MLHLSVDSLGSYIAELNEHIVPNLVLVLIIVPVSRGSHGPNKYYYLYLLTS